MNRCLIVIASFAVLSACGGGPLPASNTGGATSQPASNQGNATANMVVNVPPKSSGSTMRNRQYISASTKSMTVGILAGSNTTQLAEADLTPTSPNCSVVTGGVTQCNVSFIAPSGTNTFVLTMYDETGGKGNVLSTGDVNAKLTAGQNTTVAVDLDGVPANLSVVLGSATLPVGIATSTALYVQATDADGNLIIGPGGFATPISLAISGDTYNTLALSAISVTSPGQVVSLAYNGGTNVGSTITASTTGVPNASATFGGTGASVTYFGFSDPADGFPYIYNYAIQPLPNTSTPTAAVVMQPCCSSAGMIGIANPNGVQAVYAGDVADPFNTPAPGAVSYQNIKVIHGMSQDIVDTNGAEVSKHIAVNAAGDIFYAGAITTSGDSTNCPGGGTETTGTLGLLNPTSGTLVQSEKLLKGYPMYMQLDASGNLWFIESSGACNGSNFFTSGYALGELTAGGTLSQTDFASTGLAAVNPVSMQLSNDGSAMYIGDGNTGNLVKAALSGLTATTATLTISAYPYALAIAPDNTVTWAGGYNPGEYYAYGLLPGSKSFTSANVSEWQFPPAYFDSYGVTYADSSFWFAGNEWASGFVRVSGWTNGTPAVTQYPLMFGSDSPALTGISASDGYIWAADDNYGYIVAMQYGLQPTTGTITMTTRRIGAAKTVRNPHPLTYKAHVTR
jgi:hypothetical protein